MNTQKTFQNRRWRGSQKVPVWSILTPSLNLSRFTPNSVLFWLFWLKVEIYERISKRRPKDLLNKVAPRLRLNGVKAMGFEPKAIQFVELFWDAEKEANNWTEGFKLRSESPSLHVTFIPVTRQISGKQK